MARQARADATRDAVVMAAATAFDQHGYGATSLSEIVRILGKSKGAVYFHFGSKQEIAQAVMAAQTDDFPVLASGSPVQDLVDLSMHLADRLRSDVKLRAGVRLAIEQASFVSPDATPYAVWIDVVQQMLTAAREAGELQSHVDPDACAQLIIGAFTGVQLLSHVSSARADLRHRLVLLWRTLLPGMVAPETLSRVSVELHDPVSDRDSGPTAALPAVDTTTATAT